MSSISLEAFDGNLRGKLSQWILPSNTCALPLGFQDQLLSGSNPFSTSILLTCKTESKGWLLAYSWDMMFCPDSPTDWSLILSVIQHLKKPILIVTTPNTAVPQAFWQKCLTGAGIVSCVCLKEIGDLVSSTPSTLANAPSQAIPYFAIFFPNLETINEAQLTQCLLPFLKDIDHRSLYRELRGSGASICLSISDSKKIPQYTPMWFYPEKNTSVFLSPPDLKSALLALSERLTTE